MKLKVKLTRIAKIDLVLCILLFIGGIISLIFVQDDATQSRIAFQMFEVALMILLIFLPAAISKILTVKIPPLMEVMFVTFCFCSLILGDIANFYARFEWWDNLQHGLSGMLLGILGYIIINTFNSIEGNKFRYSPFFVTMWVICFALAVGALWEILEYLTDHFFGLNSQQYLTTSGTFDGSEPLKGHAALKDTMEDLMLDLGGSTIIAVIGYFDLKKQRKGIADLTLEAEDNDENEAKQA